MVTIFDWVSIILFSGIAVLYLQRSAQPEPSDKVWHYIAPAVGCAAVNYSGNHGEPEIAAALIRLRKLSTDSSERFTAKRSACDG